ncbi:hypothetical protein [Micromonospora fulviviridis]|uniref:Uncharacterized protein n=1 Tax=Micromonospora fulviviridis TaxID=47860 RepID=A0ABV2VFH8_9ACTN
MDRRARPAALLLAGLVVLMCGLVPGVAQAHGGSQSIPDAAYYRAELRAVTPSRPGIQVRVDPGGEWIELTNTGPDEVIVLGYTREPYLRITATEVQENELSQTTYLNRSLFADSVPSGQDAGTLAPAWKTVGDKGTARWHDHRIHWMGQGRPPAVAADPRHPHPIGDWTVHATVAGQPLQMTGDLRWLGKPGAADGNQLMPSWLLWLIEAMMVVIALLVGLQVHQLRRGRRHTGDAAGTGPRVPAGSS